MMTKFSYKKYLELLKEDEVAENQDYQRALEQIEMDFKTSNVYEKQADIVNTLNSILRNIELSFGNDNALYKELKMFNDIFVRLFSGKYNKIIRKLENRKYNLKKYFLKNDEE